MAGVSGIATPLQTSTSSLKVRIEDATKHYDTGTGSVYTLDNVAKTLEETWPSPSNSRI